MNQITITVKGERYRGVQTAANVIIQNLANVGLTAVRNGSITQIDMKDTRHFYEAVNAFLSDGPLPTEFVVRVEEQSSIEDTETLVDKALDAFIGDLPESITSNTDLKKSVREVIMKSWTPLP